MPEKQAACSYLPSASRSIFLSPLYFLGFAGFAFAAAHFEIWLARDPQRFLYSNECAASLPLLLPRRTAYLVMKVLEADDFGIEGKIRFVDDL